MESEKINCEKPDVLLQTADEVVARMHSRIKLISAMHEIMKSMNNEDAYMEWIYIVPDEPSEDDFRSIAESDEDMAECEEAFFRIIKRYGKDGLFYYQKYQEAENVSYRCIDVC